MVVQVWMTEEFTRKGEQQRPEFWAAHLAAMDRHRVRLVQEMWRRLEPYVLSGVTGALTPRDGLWAGRSGQGSVLSETASADD